MFILNSTEENSLTSLWTDHSYRTSSFRHHNNSRHQSNLPVSAFNIRPVPTSSAHISKQKPLNIALFNTRSLNNKSLILNEFITDNILDLLCLTETWQKPLDYLTLNQTTPAEYSYMDNPRTKGRGGGIAAIHRQDLNPRPLPIPAAPSFEHLVFKLPGPKPIIIAIIYRPPKPNPSFLSDFSDFFTQLSLISSSILLLGDFNIHIDFPDCKATTNFLDILNCFNLTQHVNFPTHSHGHILDLVCSIGIHCYENNSTYNNWQ